MFGRYPTNRPIRIASCHTENSIDLLSESVQELTKVPIVRPSGTRYVCGCGMADVERDIGILDQVDITYLIFEPINTQIMMERKINCLFHNQVPMGVLQIQPLSVARISKFPVP